MAGRCAGVVGVAVVEVVCHRGGWVGVQQGVLGWVGWREGNLPLWGGVEEWGGGVDSCMGS